MNFIQKKMNKKGFTLVELIIVIAVMAILAAIVIPRMGGITQSFKVKADERVAEQLARSIETQVQIGSLSASTWTDLSFAQINEAVLTPKSISGHTFRFAIDSTNVYVYVNNADLADAAAFNSFTGVKYTKTHGGKIQ